MQNFSLKLGHKLTFATVANERARILKALENNDNLLIDLMDVVLCDSAGLALLIDVNRNCTRLKKHLNLENIPNEINSLARFCGVDELLHKQN